MSSLQNVTALLSSFKIAKFVAVYETGSKGLHLPPYKGSTFRGSFGHIFREVACTCPRNRQGHVESYFPDCPYAYIFETAPPEEAEVLKNYESIPRPFLMEPPSDSRTFYGPGERFSVGFTLFGQGIEYFPYFVYVFDQMGKEGFGKHKHSAELRQIFAVDINGDWIGPVYRAADRVLRNDYPIISGQEILSQYKSAGHDMDSQDKNGQVCLYFLTPTRMKYNGRYIDEPEFHVILRSIVRRISALLYFHHNQIKLDMDFGYFFDEAKDIQLVSSEVEWIDWERYSNRQKERLKMGGIIGKAEYKGDLQAYYPWLNLAEWVNIGKNPVFGLGKVRFNAYYIDGIKD